MTNEFSHHPHVIKSENLEEREYFGLGYELFICMRKYKNNIAQFILEENTHETYEIVLQNSIRTALKLKSKNLGDDAIVGVCVMNPHSHSCIPLIAALFLGYRVVAFDGSVPASDTSFLLQKVMPSIMFIDEQSVTTMESALKQCERRLDLVVFGEYGEYSMFSEYQEENEREEELFEPVKSESDTKTALILFSSGTTGLSKGICLPQKGVLYAAYNMCCLQSISSESVIFYLSNIHWISSNIWLISSLIAGAARVICPISRAWEAIHEYKITHINMSPYLASVLAEQYKPAKLKTDSVKSLFTAGTRLYGDLRTKLTNLFPKALVTQCYGQTEAIGWITMFQLDMRKDRLLAETKPDSVGTPIPGFWYKIVDPETEKCMGPNRVGELRIKCQLTRMTGYFNQDSSNEFDSDGWMKTGDLMFYDEDQCFFFLERCKEMLKYRGFHIQPQKLESILKSHPAVEEAVVIGITHEVDGDHPMGLVVLKKDKFGIAPKDLELYVEKQVQERQRLRAGVKIIDTIPFTSTGKPKRIVLRKLVESGVI